MTVHVTRHAAEQARNRRMYQDGDVEELIADDVRAALDWRGAVLAGGDVDSFLDALVTPKERPDA